MPKDFINSNFPHLYTKIQQLLINGRDEIYTYEELQEYPLGSIISFCDIEGIFYHGGILTEVTNKYFKVDKTKYNHDDINVMWIGHPTKLRNDILVFRKDRKIPTSNPVYLGDTIIYYARDKHDVLRFKNTEKYKKLLQWYEKYCKKVKQPINKETNYDS